MEELPPINYCQVCGSELEMREALGQQRPACPACGHIHFRDPKVAAAVVMLQDGRVLLVRRVNPPEQGKWSLPAGFVDAGEDPRLAAERECLEETGLRVRVTALEDVLFSQEHARGADIVIIYRCKLEGGNLRASDDAEAVGFFELDRLPPLAFDTTRETLRRLTSEG